MANDYEINAMSKEESWRILRIMGELIQGFDELSGVEPAITFYGSSRLKESDPLYAEVVEISRRLTEIGFSIITGGGPGVMEAANRGAFESGGTSIGLDIDLPMEQLSNPFTTRSIRFHHFFARKVMLVKYATAFVIIPGGWGTLDELSEVVTLIQTLKIKPFPVILFKSEYWDGLLKWMQDTVLERGYISSKDMELIRVSDEIDEIIDCVQSWYLRHEIVGRKAIRR